MPALRGASRPARQSRAREQSSSGEAGSDCSGTRPVGSIFAGSQIGVFDRNAPLFREGEEEAVSTSLENALWCRAALLPAKNIMYLNQRLDRASKPLEGDLTRYVSTRGEAPVLSFCDVMLTGLARDGGLYVPEAWPQLSPQVIADFFGRPYWEVAVDVISPFVGGEISNADLGCMANEAYATFRHPAVVPLDQAGPNQFMLELFHGPTLAFKDVAMQLISRLMDHVLAQRAQRTTIGRNLG